MSFIFKILCKFGFTFLITHTKDLQNIFKITSVQIEMSSVQIVDSFEEFLPTSAILNLWGSALHQSDFWYIYIHTYTYSIYACTWFIEYLGWYIFSFYDKFYTFVHTVLIWIVVSGIIFYSRAIFTKNYSSIFVKVHISENLINQYRDMIYYD